MVGTSSRRRKRIGKAAVESTDSGDRAEEIDPSDDDIDADIALLALARAPNVDADGALDSSLSMHH